MFGITFYAIMKIAVENKLISKYFPADYADCFSTSISASRQITAAELFERVFNYRPPWLKFLYKIRNFLVKPFGIKINRSFADLIIEQDVNEIVLHSSNKHLDFYVSVFCSDKSEGGQSASITTLVKFNNVMGKIYFAAIWFFHKLIVSKMLKRAVNILAEVDHK